jgi:hypothetical protein
MRVTRFGSSFWRGRRPRIGRPHNVPKQTLRSERAEGGLGLAAALADDLVEDGEAT